jgi:transposase
MNLATVGIDPAKSASSVHGVAGDGKTVLRRSVGRADLLPMFAQMPRCLIGMEACFGADHLRASRSGWGTTRGSWRRASSRRTARAARTTVTTLRRSARRSAGRPR